MQRHVVCGTAWGTACGTVPRKFSEDLAHGIVSSGSNAEMGMTIISSAVRTGHERLIVSSLCHESCRNFH